MKAKLKKVGASVLAGLTSREAVSAEKIIAVVILTRVAVVIPGVAVWIDLLIKALQG